MKTLMTERDKMKRFFDILPYGGDDTTGGYNTAGDIVYKTNDGIEFSQLWDEAQQVLALLNAHGQQLVNLLSFPVTKEVETVPQVGAATFEEASEFGEPEAERIKLSYFQLGYDFKDYDRATRFTWRFLRDADAAQIAALSNSIIEGDKQHVFRRVMSAIFDNRNRNADIQGAAYNVYPLYNGDSTVPPPFGSNTFTAPHSHYLVSGNTKIDSGDLEGAYEHIAEHGYSIENGTQFVMLMNRAELKEVKNFRAGEVNNNGAVAEYDFIPGRGLPTQILDTPLGLLGSLPPETWKGLKVYGSYGDILLIEEPTMPQKYFLTFGTGGAGNLQNLVGFRQHKTAAYQGLKIMPGRDQRYPLIESYYTRGFGTGIRQRAGGVVTQIKASGSYDIPDIYNREKLLYV